MKMKNNQPEINVGVDTGKHQLDIHIRPLTFHSPSQTMYQKSHQGNFTQHALLSKQPDVSLYSKQTSLCRRQSSPH